MAENYKLSHLQELEAESIHIIREVAAEFENPVITAFCGIVSNDLSISQSGFFMIISSNELHPIKAFFSIFLTEYGTTIFLRLMQFSNAPAPISLTVPFLIST